MGTRVLGVIVRVVEDERIGSFGLIESGDKVYVWTARAFYRDGTRLVPGEAVFFEAVDGYAVRVGAPLSHLLPR